MMEAENAAISELRNARIIPRGETECSRIHFLSVHIKRCCSVNSAGSDFRLVKHVTNTGYTHVVVFDD